jgi:tetratricopeptide (TPR) repeat protein
VPQAFRAGCGRLRYCTLFRNVLVARLAAAGTEAVRAANVRTALALEGTGRITEALAYYVRGREFGALTQVIEKHGLAFVEAGYGDTILEAIEALDPIAQTNSGVILAIKAMFESRVGRFDTAESWFQLAIDRAADSAVRNRITYQYCTHLLRFFRPEAVALLEGLADDPATEDDLRAYALAALGPAYIFERRLEEASLSVERALKLADASQNAHLRARTHHQAAYVALYRGDGERSKRLAGVSLAMAREHGYFDVAAGALTVLYSIVSDLEDDPAESLRLLEDVADCAAKSGSLTNHLLALVAKLEIEVERGDENAIAGLDEKLRTLDVTCCSRASYEALLPSQALRASWNSDYAGAYRLLANSVWQQWSNDRRALRWAEIGVYAAAAALPVEATAAIRCALELLEGLEPLDVRVARARLLIALAAIILGRPDEANEMFETIDAHPQALSPRLRALRQALGALRDRYRGVRNQDAILSYFQELERQHLGGIARMIMTLPLTDNASLRLKELSMDERRTLAQVALDRSFASDTRVESLVSKLGCADRQAALRAVVRHPFIVHLSVDGAVTAAEKLVAR